MSSTLHLFLLFAVFISYHGATNGANAQLVDRDGQLLRSGINYYILPLIGGDGGGVTMSKSKNQTCPNSVVQDVHDRQHGLPIQFLSSDKSSVIVSTTDLNFKFSATSIWKLDHDETINQWFISTCGVEGNPGQTTVSNWFKIEEYEEGFMIRFCPTVCSFCKVMCGNIGVIKQR